MTTVGNDGHDDSSLKHNEHQSYGLPFDFTMSGESYNRGWRVYLKIFIVRMANNHTIHPYLLHYNV
jgi:hypothetical protein